MKPDLPQAALAQLGRRHRWKVLGVGVAANAAFSAAFAGIPATAVVMRAQYQLSTAQLGLVLGMMGLGVAISELPWGLLTDRWGDRRVLLLGLFATALWLLALAVWVVPGPFHAPGVSVLACSLLVLGLLGGSVNGSSGRAIMAWFREGERGLAMSIRQTAVPTGGGLGALILPTLALAHGYAAVYIGLAVFGGITGTLAWFWIHEPPTVTQHAAATNGVAQPTHGPLRDANIWRVAIAITLLCVPQVAVLTFATVFLHDFAHVSTLTLSATLVTIQLSAAVVRVWSGHWTDKHQNRRTYIRVCSVLSAAAFALLAAIVQFAAREGQWLLYTTPVIITALVLAGICISAWHGVAYTELATLAGANRAGTALGLANTGCFIAFFIVPLCIPAILLFSSWPMVWLLAGIFALAALPVLPKPVRNAAISGVLSKVRVV
ncbi:MFS transporter [Silvimonas soli]|uniref:MFS transporter n=1 Tax=Silvimonas soli TaxID=2980100 RepID=UPI0024B3A243|nr:MFS transporter [Silvimonas soli]